MSRLDAMYAFNAVLETERAKVATLRKWIADTVEHLDRLPKEIDCPEQIKYLRKHLRSAVTWVDSQP